MCPDQRSESRPMDKGESFDKFMEVIADEDSFNLTLLGEVVC